METGLLMLIFDIAAALAAHGKHHFGEEILHILLGARSGGVVANEFGIAYVECSAEQMCRRVDRIAVAPSQPLDKRGGAEHTCHFYPIITATPGFKRIAESGTYVSEQPVGLRHKIRKRMGEVVEIILRAAFQARQRSPCAPGICDATNRGNSHTARGGNMEVVAVIEHTAQRPYGVYVHFPASCRH